MNKEKSYLSCISNKLKEICKIITYFIVIISLIFFFSLFICFIYIELSKDIVILDTFEIPNELQKKGYTSQVLVSKLNDQITKIKQIANTTTVQEDVTSFTYFEKTKEANLNAPRFPNIEKQKEFNIKIKGIEFHLSFLLQYIKPSKIHIACEVTLMGNRNQLKLTTRVLGTPAKVHCG